MLRDGLRFFLARLGTRPLLKTKTYAALEAIPLKRNHQPPAINNQSAWDFLE